MLANAAAGNPHVPPAPQSGAAGALAGCPGSRVHAFQVRRLEDLAQGYTEGNSSVAFVFSFKMTRL